MIDIQYPGFVPDAPLVDPGDDKFGRSSYARDIADLVAKYTSPESITLGIYGQWGSGKSTLLNFIEHYLSRSSEYIVVRFNPWQFSEEPVLYREFFESLASVFADAGNQNNVLSINLKVYGAMTAVSALGSYAAYQYSHSDPVIAEAMIAATEKTVTSIAKWRSKNRKNAPAVLAERKKAIEDLLVLQRKKVIVLFDDLDRLDASEIRNVFRLIKVVANFKNTRYILSFDPHHVTTQLDGDLLNGSGRTYLDKIVQVPLSIPKAPRSQLREQLEKIISMYLSSDKKRGPIVTPEDQYRLSAGLQYFIEPKINSARLIKKYFNALALTVPSLIGEVNIIDLLLLEALRVVMPELHGLIADHENLLVDEAQVPLPSSHPARSSKEIKVGAIDELFGHKLLKSLTAEDIGRARTLVRLLFPAVDHAYSSAYHADDKKDDLAAQQRVASHQYFNRFFAYTVPYGDVGDSKVTNLVSSMDRTMSATEAKGTLETFFLDADWAPAAINKLIDYRSLFSDQVSINVIRGLCAYTWTKLPESYQSLRSEHPFLAAVDLVVAELRKKSLDVKGLLLWIMQYAPSLEFAAEILRWTYGSEAGDLNLLKSEEEKGVIAIKLAHRIKRQYGLDPNSVLDSARGGLLIETWRLYGTDAGSVITKSIKIDPEVSYKLISINQGTAYYAGEAPKPADVGQDLYNKVTSLVDVDDMMGALQTLVPQNLNDVSDFHHGMKTHNDRERFILQFAYFHSQESEHLKLDGA